jgi:phosphoserine aminotransferase
MPHRVINFNPGPAAIPLSVLEAARDELLDFEGTGMSILEHSHRGTAYERVHFEAMALLRELLAIPASHTVLLLQGGAHHAFALVPLNFLPAGRFASYVVTGSWSERAFEEARTVGAARSAGPDLAKRYTRVPRPEELVVDPATVYLHLTSNNTVEGTQYAVIPDLEGIPLVADMSSDLLSRPLDFSRVAMAYAGAQKNLGAAGVTVYVVRHDLLDGGRRDIPKFFQLGVHAAHDSLYNTPPTFAVYLLRGVLRWVKAQGGVGAMARRNEEKATEIYALLDRLRAFYRCPVEPTSRSRMNVVFRLRDEALEARFVQEAEAAGMVGLKGHRSVGGIRVSMYNAVTLEDVRALTGFMEDFARRNA